jgi:hypothetical protein
MLDRLQKVELLRVLALPGCPLCRLAHEDEDRALRALLREGSSNARLLGRLARAGGFCRSHAWALQHLEEETWRDGLINASLARPLLQEALDSLETSSTKRRTASRPEHATGGAPCPICATLASLQTSRALQLAGGLADEELAHRFAAREQGLCLPHFRLVWGEEMADAVRASLREVQRRQMRRLVEHLDGYLRTHHMHVTDEPSPEERESWRAAVAALSGEDHTT